MMDRLLFILTLLTALGCGLIAGVFFAFSTFVMSALGRLLPPQGIAAMQSINVTVINPWFLTAFVGTALACVVLAIWSVMAWHQPGAAYLLAGSVLYVAGCFLVTIVFNVPLNDALAAVEPASAEGASLWTRYLLTWTIWNHVRTVASLAAAAMFVLALR